MGSGIQICNDTPSVIHLAISQIGPLYYENYVNPNECMTRNNIGNIHARIEVIRGSDDKTFNLHITSLTIFSFFLFFTILIANIIMYHRYHKSKHIHKISYIKRRIHKLLGYSLIMCVAFVTYVLVYGLSSRGFPIFTNCTAWNVTGGFEVNINKNQVNYTPYNLIYIGKYQCQ